MGKGTMRRYQNARHRYPPNLGGQVLIQDCVECIPDARVEKMDLQWKSSLGLNPLANLSTGRRA